MKKFPLLFWGAAWALTLSQVSLANEPPEPQIVFGLTNVPLGQAVLINNIVTNLGSSGVDGVSIVLGEADSGVFAYPDTISNPTDDDFMLGKAYGKLNGVPDQLLCTVRGRKVTQPTGFGVYPLTLDFSALGVTNFLAQVYTRMGRLVAQFETGAGEPVIRTDFNGYHITRINPFWRTPDGGIAVVLDFPGSTGFQVATNFDSPPDGPIPFGHRLVLRSLNPTGVVEFVSRVDVTTGGLPPSEDEGGLTTFHMNEMRPAVFGRPHKAIGDIALQAKVGALKIARLNSAEPDPENDFLESPGVYIELDRARSSTIEFEPVDLSGASAQFGITPLLWGGGSFWYFSTTTHVMGTLRLRQTTNGLILTGVFEHLGTNAQQVRMAVYRSGALVGESPVIELEDNLFPLVTISGNPHVVRAEAQANTLEAPPAIGLAFDVPTTFRMTNGSDALSFEGDEVKFLSIGPIYLEFPLTETWLESVSGILINSRNLTDFTITGEREERVPPPPLTITRVGGEVRLSWPDPNRAHYLQTSSQVDGEFTYATYPDNSNPIATASDIITTTNAARFYRLIHAGAVD